MLAAVSASVWWSGVGLAYAAVESPPAAATVLVDLPLKGGDDDRLRGRIERAAKRLQDAATADRRPVLVLEFRRVDEDAADTPFERALAVARFLVDDDLAGVRTIAFLPDSLSGHATLLALACEELALAPDAEFGAATAGDDPSRGVEPGVLALYQQIAASRRAAPPAVVTAMVDRSVALLRVETDEGVRLITETELEGLDNAVAIGDREVLTPAGTLATFTGREARAEGIAQYQTATRAALARALGLPSGTLMEDRSLAEDWRPVMIDIAGPVSSRSVRRFQTLLADEIAPGGANWVGLRIDSDGGDVGAGVRLARTLAELEESEVRTVAYVPRRAAGVAALVALACDQLVMQSGAELVGEDSAQPPAAQPAAAPPVADQPMDDLPEAEEDDADAAEAPNQPVRDPDARPLGAAAPEAAASDERARIDANVAAIRASLADAVGRPWSVLASTIDPSIELRRYTQRESGERRLMSKTEVDQLADRDQWQTGEVVSAAGEPLSLTTTDAVRLGTAWREVEQFDELSTLYGFAASPRTAKPNWALELVEALASPGLAALLLVIGVVGLYIELSTPGLGLGGFIASVAFLLFFWSKFLDGTADWLEVLLFVAGVVFLLLEVVVLPGFGVFGLGGGLMVIAALVLAGQTFLVPKTPAQLDELRDSLGSVAGAAVACLVGGMVLRQYLPHSPFFRRAMLMPPEKADRIEQDRRESLADYAHLVGQQGVATVDLLPGGRAEIAGELVDVIAQGDLIERGDPIEVVSARGARVVVRRVSG
ncbi:MAG: NfeD family protein [Planctomycetota bacterium]